MTKFLTTLALLACASTGESFTTPSPLRTTATRLFSEPEGGDAGLILDTSEIEGQMAGLRNKYPTAEADYLAAARKRAEMKVESQNNMSTDEDWKRAAQAKQKEGGAQQDDWEASLQESGNQDSQILIPMDIPDGSEGEDGPEPTLLL